VAAPSVTVSAAPCRGRCTRPVALPRIGLATPLIALAPILAVWDTWVRVAALVPSMILTMATSVLRGFDYQTKWVVYRGIREALIGEMFQFDMAVTQYAEYAMSEDRADLFIRNVESILKNANQPWSAVHLLEEDKSSRQNTSATGR
jgi:Protein of unknown function (DUF4231)